MNIRNAKHTATSAIELEYEHPVYGWIPYLASPDDVELIGRELHALALAGVVAPYVAPAPTMASLTQALTDHLDDTAQQRRYDNRITCMVRAGFVGPFQADGIAFATWCDTCNATAYALLAEVQAGTRPMPATEQELIDAMPLMVWPTP